MEKSQAGMQRHNESYPIRDKSTRRDRFTLKHKHNIGTDLEAPVVWLLLRGKRKTKGTEKGQGGEKRGGLRSSETFSNVLKCRTLQNGWTEPELK